MRRIVVMGLGLALMGACASDSVDTQLEGDPGLSMQIRIAKADGVFGSRETNLGTSETGTVGGDSLGLYSIQLEAGDRFLLSVERRSGDLRPSGYLYEGVNTFIAPDDYTVSADAVSVWFTVRTSGLHHLVVRPYRGQGRGDYELRTECTGGPCAGASPLTGVARADQCLVQATDCVIARLPSYNGRVGEATASELLGSCLLEEGSDCANACDAATELRDACDALIAEAPSLADKEMACLVELTVCLDACQFANPFGYSDDTDLLASVACWSGLGASDFYGNCVNYAAGHTACGGSDYGDGTYRECIALCESTDGAFDEGPFDGCEEYAGCSDIAASEDGYIDELAIEVGQDVSVDADPALEQIDYANIPSEARYQAERVVSDFDEQAMRDGTTDRAFIYEDEAWTVNVNGNVIGYVIRIDYAIDDPLFDGAGVYLYINTRGSIVTRTNWEG